MMSAFNITLTSPSTTPAQRPATKAWQKGWCWWGQKTKTFWWKFSYSQCRNPFKTPLIFTLKMRFSLQGLASKLQAHEKKLQGHVLKICQIDFRLCCYSLRTELKKLGCRPDGPSCTYLLKCRHQNGDGTCEAIILNTFTIMSQV